MIESLQDAIVNGKHNQLILAVMGGVFVFFSYGRRAIINAFIMVRLWSTNRASASRDIEVCKQAIEIWNNGIEAKVLLALDENELNNRMLAMKLEKKIEHTNKLLESFITENQAEMNGINKHLTSIREAGL